MRTIPMEKSKKKSNKSAKITPCLQKFIEEDDELGNFLGSIFKMASHVDEGQRIAIRALHEVNHSDDAPGTDELNQKLKKVDSEGATKHMVRFRRVILE